MLINLFMQIEDPRRSHLREYPLVEILFLVFSGVSSGYFTWEEIALYGEMKKSWLRKYLPYENGIPSHDTINRTLSLLSTKSLEKCLVDWREMQISMPNGTVINVDGKKLRRSVTSRQQQTKKAEGGKQAAQILHAWSSSLSVCLAQKQIESKHNEITDLPKLLDMLEIANCVITTDCMNCQRGTVEYIIDRGADYVLGVKGNQPTLLTEVEKAFEREQIPVENRVTVEEKSHGREEKRICEVLPESCIAKYIDINLWKGIKSIIRTKSTRKEPYKEPKEEYRYHISSLDVDVNRLYEIIRGHWAVENQLHWILDVCMNEDASRKRAENAAVNFSCIRKMVINSLNTLDFNALGLKKKMSLPNKMAACALSDDIREACLGLGNLPLQNSDKH